MEMTLEVQSRNGEMKAKELLRNDILPLEYYGKGVDNRSLQVNYQDFRRMLRQAGKTVITLVVDGKDKLNVLVHDYQRDPITDKMTHVDLINVDMNKELTATVPLKVVGTAPAVKELGGILQTPLSSVEITCLPKDLIHSIEVDVSVIKDFATAIHVSDLSIPAGVKVATDEVLTVASVVPPKGAVVETAEESEGSEGTEDSAE